MSGSSERMMEAARPAAHGAARGGGRGVPGAPPRMGGIALRNGLVLLTERHWAAAVREADGSISVSSGRKPRLSPSGRVTGAGAGSKGGSAGSPAGVPLLRGLGRFGESLLVLAVVKIRLPGAELPLEGGRVAAALAGSLVATAAVKSLVPKSALLQEAGSAAAAFVPAVLALKNSPISGYHGAEHKVIGSREAGFAAESSGGGSGGGAGAAGARSAARAAERFAAAQKEHDRCGSNLVGPYLLATMATNLIARGRSGHKSPAASAIAGAVSLGVALEALRWATRNGDSMLARLLLMPGRALQKHLTTAEPSADQLEVGERAMAELLRLEASASPMATAW